MLAFGTSNFRTGILFNTQELFALHLTNGCSLNQSWTREGTVTTVVTVEEATYLVQSKK